MSLPQLNLCVFECPIGYFAYLVTQFCFDVCPQPYFADPSTRTCVLQCPISQLLYADNISRTCVSKCPSGSYAYQWAVSCLPNCPVASAPYVQTYAADYDNTCVVQCAYPYYSYDVTLKCLTSCPDPFYNNLESHSCIQCPSTCSSCTGANSCTSCFAGFFLQNGECLISCTLIYYANPATRTCVRSNYCAPYFGQNSTRQCVASCATGSFKNSNLYRCDACPSTCVTCTSLTNCLSCITNSVSYNNFCHGYCNVTSNGTVLYFNADNLTCTQSCPNGTYLVAVYCLSCASQCSSCSISASNCTKCSKGQYLFNYGCVTSCPTYYKPSSNLECVFCDTTCGEGLTYGTNITNVNGQTSMYINFNNAVNITGNIYSTISVTSSKRLLQTTSTSPGYQLVVVGPNTVQVVFPPGTSASTYNVQLTNPQNIVDANGNLPSSLTSSVSINGNDQYASSSSLSATSFPLFFTFLGVICVITFIFDIELMKFLQLIYIHYFVMMNLPPVLMKVFSGLRYSTLYYLPMFYSVPTAVLKPTVPSSIYNQVGDYNFLRNAGFAFTPLAVILFVMAILKLLSVPEINKYKDARVWCSRLLEEKFKYAMLL